MKQPTHTEHAMQACIEACSHCHQACLQTAMIYCLKTGGKHVEACETCAKSCRKMASAQH